MLRQLTNKFLHRVRIHGGEFDSSARAMNRAEQGDLFQAELRKFRGSTFERKQMSTTIKRVALVAVAALGLGVVSVAPSTAAQTAAQSYIYCSQADGGAISNTTTTGATCGGIAGASNYVTLTGVQTTKDVELTVSGSTFVAQSGSTFVTNTAGTVALASAANANTTIKVATPSTGTITVTVKYATAGSGIFTASTETVVITVAATALSGTYSATNSAAYLVAGETFTATADDATAPTAAKTYTATDSATASIVVYYKDGLGNAITNDTLTATITSGPGTILTVAAAGGQYDSVTAYSKQSSHAIASYSSSSRADNSGRVAFFVYANGLAGTTVVTVKNSAGTVVATKSLVFTDTTIASIEATVLKPFVQGDTAGHTSNAIKLVFKDAAGNVMKAPASYPTVASGATTIGTASQVTTGGNDTTTATAGAVYWGVDAVGAKYGPVTYTFTAGTVTATATLTFSSAVAATFTGSAANTTANGDVVYTFTAKDANGYAVPEGLALSNYVSSVASVGTSGSLAAQTALTSTSKSGVWTTTAVSAPSATTDITSTFTLTGTAGTANSYLAKTLTGTDVAVKFSVSNPSIDAATDAANEAAQAASDATDAALAAADAADAATTKAQEAVDAVATLSAQVSKLITALKAQITTLTNLVIKIQKKVKA